MHTHFYMHTCNPQPAPVAVMKSDQIHRNHTHTRSNRRRCGRTCRPGTSSSPASTRRYRYKAHVRFVSVGCVQTGEEGVCCAMHGGCLLRRWGCVLYMLFVFSCMCTMHDGCVVQGLVCRVCLRFHVWVRLRGGGKGLRVLEVVCVMYVDRCNTKPHFSVLSSSHSSSPLYTQPPPKQFSLPSINRLERLFIAQLQWDLFISSSLYAKQYFALRSLAEQRGFPRRYRQFIAQQTQQRRSSRRRPAPPPTPVVPQGGGQQPPSFPKGADEISARTGWVADDLRDLFSKSV